MTRLLYWGDYTTPTGFSQVASNILRRLPDMWINYDESEGPPPFEIEVVGIGYFGLPDYDRNRFPGKIWPAYQMGNPHAVDIYGRARFLNRIEEENYDTVFLLQDLPILDSIYKVLAELKEKKKFNLVIYFPIDAYARSKWLRIIQLADFAFTYTKNAVDEINNLVPNKFKNLDYAYHGVDRNFKPLDFVKKDTEKFKLLNVNRNQSRKDLTRSLTVLAELKNRDHNDFYLYLHASPDDVGGDIRIVANDLKLVQGVDWDIAENLTPEGISFEELNKLYSQFEALITTTMGEGFGLSVVEAMATKLPVVAPRLPVYEELLSDERGILVNTGSSPSLWTVLENDNQFLRPLVDVHDMADKIINLRNQSLADTLKMTERAYKFAQEELNWDKIVEDIWIPVLEA